MHLEHSCGPALVSLAVVNALASLAIVGIVGFHWPLLAFIGLHWPSLTVVGLRRLSWASAGLHWPSWVFVSLLETVRFGSGRVW